MISLLILIGLVLFAHPALAQKVPGAGNDTGWVGALFGFDTAWDFLSYGVAWIVNLWLTVASWFVALTGILLNVSINITLHIKDFVDSTPAIYDVWRALRDISGIFIIFALLWAAIQLILGITKPNFGGLIKNIVIAGVLINFSFFVTGILIDASNVVSLTIYNAILPNAAAQYNGNTTKLVEESSTSNRANISDIFMGSLKLQKSFDTKNLNMGQAAGGVSAPFKIILSGLTGVIIMITAGLSFLFASLAFIVRLVLLLGILAFSPLWCVAYVVPQLSKYSTKLADTFKGQLMFMPAYLLLMYIALKILDGTKVFSSPATGNLWQGAQTTGVPTEFITFAINAAFVIIMLNIPLLAALELMGNTALWKGVGAGAIWKGVGNWTKDRAWRETGGRAASKVATSEKFKDLASRYKVAEFALKETRGVAKGYDEKLDKQVKSKTEFSESLGHDQRAMNAAQARLRTAQSNLASAKAAGAAPGVITNLENQVGAAKGGITTVENARKQSYATRIGTRGITDVDTLWLKVARKNKVAAAKVQIPILEKQITQRKESLKETRDDIKQLTNAIRNNPAGAGVAAGAPTAAQATQLAQLQRDEVNKLNTINGLEASIDTLKLIK